MPYIHKYTHKSCTITTAGNTWTKVGDDAACDTSKGEEFMQQSPGKLPSLEACQQACEDEQQCKSITYFNSGWCSLYSTDCSTTSVARKAVAMRLVRKA